MRGKSGGDNFIQLTKCIAQLDATYAASPSPVIYEEGRMQAEFEDLATDHSTKLLLESKHVLLRTRGRDQQIISSLIMADVFIAPNSSNSNMFRFNN